MKSVGVLQIVDSLNAAGKERVAVNLANLIHGNGFTSYLCTTRKGGVLESEVHASVKRLKLDRKKRFEISALYKLVTFVKEHEIKILHAHDTSIFIAGLASLFYPYPNVIWHDHYGEFGLVKRPVFLYRLGLKRVNGIIAVSEPLAEWARTRLRFPTERVSYLPNFVSISQENSGLESSILPGVRGSRIVCVAGLRKQKDHVTLIRAMELVIQKVPTAHLLLIGASRDQDHLHLIRETIFRCKLDRHVSFLGERRDVNTILNSCSVGVLSSAGEAFPLTLLEYGMVGLPVVATRVGQCAEILDDGRAGILVTPRSAAQLAEALVVLLTSAEKRSTLGAKLNQRVRELYSPKRIVKELCRIYDKVLSLT